MMNALQKEKSQIIHTLQGNNIFQLYDNTDSLLTLHDLYLHDFSVQPDDIMLVSLFGGLINGLAISLCLNVGTSTGGTDFISIFLSHQKGIDAWNYILLGNIVMLIAAGALFGWSKALYSIIYQFCSTQVIQLLYKRYKKESHKRKPEAG